MCNLAFNDGDYANRPNNVFCCAGVLWDMQLLALQAGDWGGREVKKTGETGLPVLFCSPISVLKIPTWLWAPEQEASHFQQRRKVVEEDWVQATPRGWMPCCGVSFNGCLLLYVGGCQCWGTAVPACASWAFWECFPGSCSIERVHFNKRVKREKGT